MALQFVHSQAPDQSFCVTEMMDASGASRSHSFTRPTTKSRSSGFERQSWA
jgi:hypothetical protein